MIGYINAFLMFALCAAAGIPLAMMMKEPPRS
jgi:hypothetical protein